METERVGQALSAREIFDLVRGDLERVEKAINVESLASVETVTTIGRYLQQSGGKRLRPALLLLCARFAGSEQNKPNDGNTAVQLGAVVEMIHAATLVHDDVIDVAQTRRGRPSANVQWGNHTCVLAGDWLYMQAFQAALRERNFHILDLLISLTQMMVEGELIQLDRIGRIDITEADCMEVADRKTACLFSACAKLGAVSAGADTAVEEKLGEFAWNLGMAFQLIDDMLDFTSREQTLGKPVGGDLKEGKVTLPLVYALESATPAERHQVEIVLGDRTYDSTSFSEIYSMVERRGGIQRTRERAQQFTDRARQVVAEFPETPYQRALCTLTDLITERDR
ncbi:MAG TPA: polyprenyl synthetase family protein [Bryobacteraceae bacterium]|jgi:octaprenyl-diphosphate synthase|nr:polyprenyl synthetase family protein [Bryobacteraceae bacterium]